MDNKHNSMRKYLALGAVASTLAITGCLGLHERDSNHTHKTIETYEHYRFNGERLILLHAETNIIYHTEMDQ